MGIIIEITTPCKCGNKDKNKFKIYDGCLGYEAVVCLNCGRYCDHQNIDLGPDEWSLDFIKRNGGLNGSKKIF